MESTPTVVRVTPACRRDPSPAAGAGAAWHPGSAQSRREDGGLDVGQCGTVVGRRSNDFGDHAIAAAGRSRARARAPERVGRSPARRCADDARTQAMYAASAPEVVVGDAVVIGGHRDRLRLRGYAAPRGLASKRSLRARCAPTGAAPRRRARDRDSRDRPMAGCTRSTNRGSSRGRALRGHGSRSSPTGTRPRGPRQPASSGIGPKCEAAKNGTQRDRRPPSARGGVSNAGILINAPASTSRWSGRPFEDPRAKIALVPIPHHPCAARTTPGTSPPLAPGLPASAGRRRGRGSRSIPCARQMLRLVEDRRVQRGALPPATWSRRAIDPPASAAAARASETTMTSARYGSHEAGAAFTGAQQQESSRLRVRPRSPSIVTRRPANGRQLARWASPYRRPMRSRSPRPCRPRRGPEGCPRRRTSARSFGATLRGRRT